RQLLKTFLESKQRAHLRYSADFDAEPANILESARRLNIEGILAKRRDAPYVSARAETWLKLKTHLRQEFVIAGYTNRENIARAAEIGSLLLGVYDEDRQLISVGSVGTGWNSSTAAMLKRTLEKIEVATAPFAAASAPAKGRWTKRPPGSERW